MEGEQDGEALARPRRRRRIAREQAVALPGMFTHVDLTVFNPPPNIREDAEELSNAAKALANTHLLATAFARFVEELGPVLKKLKPSGDSSRAASPEHVFSDYQSRWAEAAKKWLRTNITGSEGMGLVWHQFTSEEAKKVLTHSFFEANTLSIQDASLESYFIIKCGATFGQFKHHMKVLYQQAVFIYPFIGPAVLSLSLTHSHSLSLTLSHSLSFSLSLSLSLDLIHALLSSSLLSSLLPPPERTVNVSKQHWIFMPVTSAYCAAHLPGFVRHLGLRINGCAVRVYMCKCPCSPT